MREEKKEKRAGLGIRHPGNQVIRAKMEKKEEDRSKGSGNRQLGKR
jgi:hypothetical protein